MNSNWWDRERGLEQLAYIDEADSYEIDQAGIYWDARVERFVLMTATGCSCWDGEFDEERYATLDELESALIREDRNYNPTLNGAKALVKEAREAWEKRSNSTA